MEFDKNKILTSVTADQAKVGQKGWIGLTLSDLKYSFGKEDKKITLLSIRGENVTTRFVSDKYGAELLFYPAPEPTYKERQTEWVVKNKVCIGTKVRVTRDFAPKEDGSNCIFGTENVGKKKIVGEIGRVTGIYYDCIIVEVHVENWRCPFTVLEVIKEPTYRPFKNAEEFKPYRDEWIYYNGITFKHEGYTEEGIIIDQEIIDWDTAFEKYHFEKEIPFGIKEEV
jgi:hypothetical protein